MNMPSASDRDAVLSERELSARLGPLFDLAPDAMIVSDAAGLIVLANEGAVALFGIEHAALVGQPVEILVPSELRQQHERDRERFQQQPYRREMGENTQLVGARLDGSRFPADISLAPIDIDGQTYVVAAIRDVTKHQRIELALRDNEEQFRVLAENSSDVVWLLDAEGVVRWVSESVERVLGWSTEQVLGTQPEVDLAHPDDQRDLMAARDRVLAGQPLAFGQVRLRIKAGDHRWMSIQWRQYQVGAGAAGAVVGLRDVHEQVLAREEAQHSEQRLRFFMDHAAQGMALVGADSRFLRVNDALCEILDKDSEWLLEHTVSDVLAQDDAEEDGLLRRKLLAGEVRQVTNERRIRSDEKSLSETWVSHSISLLRDPDGGPMTSLEQFQDITERRAQQQKLQEQGHDIQWIRRIRNALVADRFVLYTQPIIDLATGATVQHELLIRMLDETDKLIFPDEFLPAAEAYGLINEIDCWVVGKAAELASGGTPVTINLSAASIGSRRLLDTINTAIRESGVRPSLLAFEVTETAVLNDIDKGEAFLEKLRSFGCEVLLDDFGTGYGTFTYLRRLPAQYLKIDITFTRNATHSSADRAVISAIVALAHDLGKFTIAEGVEDAETLALLPKLGVTHAQGYYIGRPGPGVVDSVLTAYPG